MNRQDRIIECLKVYPETTEEERNLITEKTLAAIGESSIEGHIGFDIHGKFDTVITFESETEIPGCQTDKLKEILSQKFGRDDIQIWVTADTNYIEQFDPENPEKRRGHYEDAWNIHIKIPHDNPEILGLREVMTDFEYTHNSHILPLPIGSPIFGEPLVIDLTRAPHMLVSGKSGMGKTTLLNNFIISLLYTRTPEELKLLLIGHNEFRLYEPLSRSYLLHPVITNKDQAMAALEDLNAELDRRYNQLRQSEVRNIKEYNATSSEPMPYIVAIIDEYSVLIKYFGEEFETRIARIAQRGRAAGIHVIMATSHADEQTVTPMIKANFPSRIALKVIKPEESQLILEEPGVEELDHTGQLLFSNNGSTHDLQTPLVTPDEIRAVVGSLI